MVSPPNSVVPDLVSYGACIKQPPAAKFEVMNRGLKMDKSALSSWADSWARKHPDIESFRGIIFDINGVARGKRLPLSQLAKICSGGMRIPLSSANVDIWGRDIEGSKWVFETGDSDGRCEWTGRGPLIMPWSDRSAAIVPLVLYNEDKTPFDGDARNVLAAILDRFETLRLRPVPAFELEFYLADPKAVDGALSNPLTGAAVIRDGVLSLDDLENFEAILSDIYDACKIQSVAADAAISESGIGQFEVNLRHNEDAMKVADDAMLFKNIVKSVARKHGLAASFMAKPFADRPGNGLHMHFSILDSNGANIFDNGDAEGSVMLHHAVAGVLAAMPESMLFFAPHLNSYRRLTPEQHAPMVACWGYENRTAAVRIPGGPPSQRRIEHRVAGADTNAYLVMAAILGAVLCGIEGKMQPPSPIKSSAYNSDHAHMATLPTSWQDSLDIFVSGKMLDEYIPDILRDMVIKTKKQEMKRFSALVTPFEYQSYLDQV